MLNMKNNIAFTQDLSDRFNEKFNPEMYSTPGKGGMTVIQVLPEDKGLAEYFVATKDGHVNDTLSRYNAKNADPELTHKLLYFVNGRE